MGMNAKRRKVRKAQREFQPTPPYGDEQTAFELNYWSGVFQPTPRIGMNKNQYARLIFFNYFNPHPRMGMNLCHYIDTHQSLFQPTPLQWGELPFAVACVGNPKFQPTSPYGDEPTGITEIFNLFHFNPHPRMGDERFFLAAHER